MICGSAFASIRKSALGGLTAGDFFAAGVIGDEPTLARPSRAFLARRLFPRRLIALLVGKERVP
jgi:hypothetical protein